MISLRSSGFVIQCFNLWRSMLSPLELLMRSEMQEGDWIRGRGQPDLPDVVHIRMGMRRLTRGIHGRRALEVRERHVMPLWQLPNGMQRYERCARWKRIAFRLIHWMPSSVRQISSARQLRNETGAFLNEFPFCHAVLAAFMVFQKLLFAEPHVARRLRGWFVSGASGFATTATMTCLL